MEQVSFTKTLVAVAILVLAAAVDGRAATRAVVAEGDPAPAGLGGTVERVVSGSVDNAGSVAFAVALSGSETASAVVVASGSEARVVARSGDAAPGGGRYASFEEVDLSDGGHMLFRARLEGGADEGVYLLTPDGVAAIAVSGGQSPRGHTYASFASLSLMADVFDEGPSYDLAVDATNLYGEGVRRVVLLDGLDGVAPVEVSDHGLLLVSASEAGRRGLFLVDGLF